MNKRCSLRRALKDPNLLGRLIKGPSWTTWRALLLACMGEPLTEYEQELFSNVTSRTASPTQIIQEFVGVIGRRGGKSRAVSVLATYISGLCTHRLVPGERGILLIIAADKSQAEICLNYIEAAFRQSPMLCQLVDTRIAHTLRLTNGCDIEVRGNDFRRLRGPTYVAVIGDEVCFWRADDSSNPDTEVLNSVRPGLATTQGPLFLISSPYARKGVMFDLWTRHYGAEGDPSILVAQGASRTFNDTLPQATVDRALERDAPAAAAEFLAQWRTDVETFIAREVVLAAVVPDRYELAPLPGTSYVAFTDPSGGSADSMTLAIGHIEGERIVLDLVRERKPPFSPDAVVSEFATTLKSYGISTVTGDRYGGSWPRERFQVHDITYRLADKTKSDYYQALLPVLNSGRAELLDNKRLIAQLTSLERRTARGGRDSIDHGPGGRDDVANAVAGAVVTIASRVSQVVPVVVPIVVGRANTVPGGSTRAPPRAPHHLGGF